MLTPDGTYWLALGVLFVLYGTVMAMIAACWRRTNYTPFQYIFYLYAFFTARILWRAQVPQGGLRLPRGGAIIVCNHRGPFDPVMIQLLANRVVHWMVAREYCEHPALGWFLRVTQCIPVSRSGMDTGPTLAAIRYAQSGELVGMFPEGRLNKTDQLLLPGRRGAALIALRAGVPVVPCYISGTPIAHSIFATLFKPTRSRLIVGEPIDISSYNGRATDRDAQVELTKHLLREIARLAGQPDYEPRLT